jgi:hypothetical protein
MNAITVNPRIAAAPPPEVLADAQWHVFEGGAVDASGQPVGGSVPASGRIPNMSISIDQLVVPQGSSGVLHTAWTCSQPGSGAEICAQVRSLFQLCPRFEEAATANPSLKLSAAT